MPFLLPADQSVEPAVPHARQEKHEASRVAQFHQAAVSSVSDTSITVARAQAMQRPACVIQRRSRPETRQAGSWPPVAPSGCEPEPECRQTPAFHRECPVFCGSACQSSLSPHLCPNHRSEGTVRRFPVHILNLRDMCCQHIGRSCQQLELVAPGALGQGRFATDCAARCICSIVLERRLRWRCGSEPVRFNTFPSRNFRWRATVTFTGNRISRTKTKRKSRCSSKPNERARRPTSTNHVPG